MVDSITKTLGAGSGVDYQALVKSLVDAQFQPRTSRLTNQADTLKAQISATSDLKNTVTSFSTALKSLTRSGALQTQPTSSSPSVAKVSALPGGRLQGFAAQLEVTQVAQAQTAATANVANAAAVGTGTLTLRFGTATVTDGAITGFSEGTASAVTINVDASNNSLQGIAAAINRARAGVGATVVTDAGGSRLVVKGQTGAAQAFTLTASEDAGAPGLAQLNIGVGGGATIGTAAQDARIKLDGLSYTRPSNSITDVATGVRIDLQSAAPGTIVALGAASQTEALRQAVSNFVDSYNEVIRAVQTQTDPKGGNLRSDYAARGLQQSLGRITQTSLVSASVISTGPRTLAELGVATNRDGTLTLRADQLDRALTNYPDAVEAMFADGASSTNGGLAAAVQAITDRAVSLAGGLGQSALRYTQAQTDVQKAQDKASSDADVMTQRLTKQFASTDARVAAYKSAQNFMKAQVDAWNSKG